MKKKVLVITQAFGDRQIGETITDATEIAKLLEERPSFIVLREQTDEEVKDENLAADTSAATKK